ncbi:pilus assembly protein Flp/PilA [Parvibaculum indicum]|uniref:Flp family type IVb pilin n=1 Tax=Parvibaculum indicum TaxID=562969 RepID=UPI001FE6560D|nr:Flp family type IVb pilin [Parvibaculum indicum]NIJ43225.1 pilus assembly protein Flp/PilA [Parvibaculum indicum]
MTMIGKIKAFGERFAEDESGISAVEYGLLAAGIAMGLWVLINPIGTDLQTIYTNVGSDLSTAAGG